MCKDSNSIAHEYCKSFHVKCVLSDYRPFDSCVSFNLWSTRHICNNKTLLYMTFTKFWLWTSDIHSNSQNLRSGMLRNHQLMKTADFVSVCCKWGLIMTSCYVYHKLSSTQRACLVDHSSSKKYSIYSIYAMKSLVRKVEPLYFAG